MLWRWESNRLNQALGSDQNWFSFPQNQCIKLSNPRNDYLFLRQSIDYVVEATDSLLSITKCAFFPLLQQLPIRLIVCSANSVFGCLLYRLAYNYFATSCDLLFSQLKSLICALSLAYKSISGYLMELFKFTTISVVFSVRITFLFAIAISVDLIFSKTHTDSFSLLKTKCLMDGVCLLACFFFLCGWD